MLEVRDIWWFSQIRASGGKLFFLSPARRLARPSSSYCIFSLSVKVAAVTKVGLATLFVVTALTEAWPRRGHADKMCS